MHTHYFNPLQNFAYQFDGSSLVVQFLPKLVLAMAIPEIRLITYLASKKPLQITLILIKNKKVQNL